MILLMTLALAAPERHPTAVIRNAHLSLTVMTPDAKLGFYRGSRFDWSGVIRDVKYNTHTLFGPWKDGHDPTNHDDITGPCEEFRTPLGYAEAKVGETFLKIGVGSLVKPQEKEYKYSTAYAIKYPGLWEITRGDDDITFHQGLLTNDGYGYKYTKTIDLLDDYAGFTIKHELTNVGTKTIKTEWYNHNFYTINKLPLNSQFMIQFLFVPRVVNARDGFTDTFRVQKDQLMIVGEIGDGSFFTEIEGYGPNAEQHGFAIHHTPTRVTMAVRGDVPLAKFLLWGNRRTICPEPYINIELKPNETKTWTLSYKFSLSRSGQIVW